MKFIILNGPPGAGKSSVAEEIHNSLRPLSFMIKFDALRRYLKDRHQHSAEAEALTYDICKSIADTCFKNDKDVIFERVIINSDVLDSFISLAKSQNAEIYEFILWADEETILQRNEFREDAPDFKPDSRRVSKEKAKFYWEGIESIISKRNEAVVIDVKANTLVETIRIVKNKIGL